MISDNFITLSYLLISVCCTMHKKKKLILNYEIDYLEYFDIQNDSSKLCSQAHPYFPTKEI